MYMLWHKPLLLRYVDLYRWQKPQNLCDKSQVAFELFNHAHHHQTTDARYIGGDLICDPCRHSRTNLIPHTSGHAVFLYIATFSRTGRELYTNQLPLLSSINAEGRVFSKNDLSSQASTRSQQ